MKYCTTSDVRVMNPQRSYHTSSKPTETQLTSMIAFISADMDVRMGSYGITVPIATSPVTTSSKFLKYVCATGAAALAEEGTFAGGNKQESTHADLLWKRYDKYFVMISANTALVTGGNGATFGSYEYDNADVARVSEPFTTTRETW